MPACVVSDELGTVSIFREERMDNVRRIIAVVGFAIGVGFLVFALSAETPSHADAVGEALVKAEINENSAESAPQQQVVNGWVARDLLVIQTRQLDELAKIQRQTNLLLGAVALLSGIGALTVAVGSSAKSSQPDDRTWITHNAGAPTTENS